jgi:DNA modification methylase
MSGPGYALLKADARRIPLADGSVHCAITSPPYYGLRDYGVDGQIGLEKTPEAFVEAMVDVFREVRRVLRDDGTLWLNLGDSYAATGKSGGGDQGRRWAESGADTVGPRGGKWSPAPAGLKPKDLMLMPARVALALQADGWYVRQECVWSKQGGMPESVRDRPSKSHEMVYLLTKRPSYFYDDIATRRPQKTLGRRHEGASGYREGHPSKGGIKVRALNPLGAGERSVWPMPTGRFKGAHFATMPLKLAAKCVRLGTSEKGCCPRCGSPWRRLIERSRVATRSGADSKLNNVNLAVIAGRPDGSNVTGYRDPRRRITTVTHQGWESSCTCLEPAPVPCVVFDPFNGAGTTGVASDALGRHYIGLDINAEYLAMANRRISRPYARIASGAAQPDLPLFAAIEGGKP